MLSKQEIAGLRELLAKASPRPWDIKTQDEWDAGFDFFGGPDGSFVFPVDGEPDDVALLSAAVNALPALLDIAEAVGWRPIETAPKARGPMIVVRGVFSDRNYVTDPWCVFWQEGKWQRWPHDDPPTHWMPLPVLPLAGEVANG